MDRSDRSGSVSDASDENANHPRSTGVTDRRARNSVTRDEVLTTALSIIDRDGLEALSMRRLAQELDVGPMRAYRHFATKEELLEALADQQAHRIRTIEIPGVTDPREYLLELGIETRLLLLEHPNLAPIVVSRPLSKTTAVEDLKLAGVLLTSAGFAEHQVGPVSAGLTAYVLGFVLYELGQRRFHGETREELATFYEELASEVKGDALLTRQVAGIRYAVDHDWGSYQFKFGLEAMINGLWEQRENSAGS